MQAAAVNKALENMINELRRERESQLKLVHQREERERAMALDMRGFAASAHAALDEKERVKGRVRRMRHEWKQERGTQEGEQMKLIAEQQELERLIETAQVHHTPAPHGPSRDAATALC